MPEGSTQRTPVEISCLKAHIVRGQSLFALSRKNQRDENPDTFSDAVSALDQLVLPLRRLSERSSPSC